MSWAALYPHETERALADRAARPRPVVQPEASLWSKTAALIGAPLAGGAQGVNETLRNVNAMAGVSGASSIDPREDPEGYAAEQKLSRAGAQAADRTLRRNVEHWRPDPATVTVASQLLHDGGRIMAKVAGYAVAGGAPAVVAGLSADEGMTEYRRLRDRGVDDRTAAEVGAVRALTTAAGAAAPAAMATKLGTAAMVVGTGPATYAVEQMTARAILEHASYPELATEYDPSDPAGLVLSAIPGAAVGTLVHAARARSARAAGATPELVEAAHVQQQQDAIDARMLGDAGDPAVRAAHDRALAAARQAMDEGRPVEVGDIVVDEARAQAVLDNLGPRVVDATVQADAAQAPPRARRDPLAALDERARETATRTMDAASRGVPVTPTGDPLRVEPRRRDGRAGPAGQAAVVQEFVRRTNRNPKANAADVAADIATEQREGARFGDFDGEPLTPTEQALERAFYVAAERPRMPVRLDENGPSMTARDALEAERLATRRASDEQRRAFEAAVSCLLGGMD